MEWAADPSHHDFPGVDTLDPNKVHAARSERAQGVDEAELAPLADTVAEWGRNVDEFDLRGVDTPMAAGGTGSAGNTGGGTNGGGGATNPLMSDDRGHQDTLDIGPNPTQARESRTAVEQSSGGVMEDTRSAVGRGSDANDTVTEQQDLLLQQVM